MADVWETPESQARSRNRKTGQVLEPREFIITGVTSGVEAELALSASPECPWVIGPEYDGTILRRENISVAPLSNDVWSGTVAYESKGAGSWTFAGSTGGGSFNVTQGYGVRSYGTAPPNFQGAINVTENGVEGVDVVVPQLEFSLTKTQDFGFVSPAYMVALKDITGTTNGAEFSGFARGELLFLGAEFSQQSTGETSVTYKFSASPNRTGLTIGSITGIVKRGHEYLWVLYRPNQSGNYLVRVPVAVYVHQLYVEANFEALGI